MATFVLVLFLWIFSVCLHEFAHASVAYRGGDITVKDKGYLSLNPLKYLDPMSSVILPEHALLSRPSDSAAHNELHRCPDSVSAHRCTDPEVLVRAGFF